MTKTTDAEGKVERKNVSWRVEKHPRREELNEWISKQDNIQASITNIVLHFINRFGYKDVMDFDIQKTLFQDLLDTGPTVESTKLIEKDTEKDSTSPLTVEPVDTKEEYKEIVSSNNTNSSKEDDIYSTLDTDSL